MSGTSQEQCGYCSTLCQSEEQCESAHAQLEQGDTSGASVCVECGEGIAAGEVQATPCGDMCAACMVQAGAVAVSDPFNPWRAPCGAAWYGLRDGSPDDGCGWGDLCSAKVGG